jgi:hypothetical protein
MDPKQNPFSVYDFLGYFTPGALLLYGTLFFFGLHSNETSVLDHLKETLSFDKPEIYIPFVLISYVAGHLINYMSSITVERYSIWALDYPSRYLLNREYSGYFGVSEHKTLRRFLRLFIAILILPVSVLDFLLGYLFGMRDLYAKKLDDFLITIIQNKSKKLIKSDKDLGFNAESEDHQKYDSFRYIYHYAVEHSANHLPKMQNYVALYGFLRSLTLLSVILFWCLLWHVYFNPLPSQRAYLEIACTSLLAFAFYIAFVKFYRRFTLEAFMAATVVNRKIS